MKRVVSLAYDSNNCTRAFTLDSHCIDSMRYKCFTFTSHFIINDIYSLTSFLWRYQQFYSTICYLHKSKFNKMKGQRIFWYDHEKRILISWTLWKGLRDLQRSTDLNLRIINIEHIQVLESYKCCMESYKYSWSHTNILTSPR